MILLERLDSGVVAQAQTDSQGKFQFRGLGQMPYTLTIRLRGYETYQTSVDLTMMSHSYLQIKLRPVSPPSLPPAGAGKQVDRRELAAPPNAEKEFERGRKILVEERNPSGSITHFRKAIELYPSYAKAYFFLGGAYMEMGKPSEAQSAFEDALQQDSKLGLAYLGLGASLNQQGKFGAAQEPLARGLELQPDAAPGYYELGRSYFVTGSWEKAEAPARRAAELDPKFAAVHVLLGNIMLKKGDVAAALKEFQECLRLDPNGPTAAPTRAMVKKIEAALAQKK
jgi:tetratricopeptide (TPR) repeat protein